jgi:amino acid transporter
LTEASQIIDYIVMCITYLRFYKALKAQGIDRRTLPYRGWGQPYVAWIGLIWMVLIVFLYGYTTFLPGYWSVGTFFDYYLMIGVAPILYFGWKFFKKTKIIRPQDVDLVW